MTDCLEQIKLLDYKDVLKYFIEISRIPRGSGNNKRISDFLVEFARKNGLTYVQDDALNVVIYKQAGEGYENHPPVMIQGHMDMVCVAEEGITHNFEEEGLKLQIDGDFFKADGTTLGGDDGIAVAYGMALLADQNALHPALEVVITTDEETGMNGADFLDASLLKSKMMVNVDSEEEGVVWTSCAGGLHAEGILPLEKIEKTGAGLKLIVKGLQGGHSGAEIHKNRTNAILLLGRALFELHQECDYFLVSMQGGEKDNAIPSFAEAHIVIREEELKNTESLLKGLNQKYQKELALSEPNVVLVTEYLEEDSFSVLSPICFEKMLFILNQAPNGIQTMSSAMPGLVESSLNLGIFGTEEEAVFQYSIRSSVSSYKYYLRDRLEYLFTFLGGECTGKSEYPGWEYKKDSPLRDLFCCVFQKQYGKKPQLTAIHAGLECGLISEKIPDIDIISIGPDMQGIHTPNEKLSISSSIRVYQLIEKLLKEMK